MKIRTGCTCTVVLYELCSFLGEYYMSLCVRKPTICLGENKAADQLRGNREADQRLCFRYSDSTIPLLLKSEISSFWLFSVLVQAGLCQTWSEPQIVGFVTHRLILETNHLPRMEPMSRRSASTSQQFCPSL